MTWNLFFTPVDMVEPVLTWWTRFWPKTAWHSFFTLVDMVWPVLTRWTRFWPKMTVLTRNGLKLMFYPGRYGLTLIDSVDLVLTENDGFDPKRPETHFLPWSTWFDPYWLGGLGFDPKRLETHFLPWSTWCDPYWPGGIGSYGKMRLTRAKFFFFNFKLFLNFFGFL